MTSLYRCLFLVLKACEYHDEWHKRLLRDFDERGWLIILPSWSPCIRKFDVPFGSLVDSPKEGSSIATFGILPWLEFPRLNHRLPHVVRRPDLHDLESYALAKRFPFPFGTLFAWGVQPHENVHLALLEWHAGVGEDFFVDEECWIVRLHGFNDVRQDLLAVGIWPVV